MPGLLGIGSTRGPDEAVRRFGVASERMLRHGGMAVNSVSALDGTCRIGHAHLLEGTTVENHADSAVTSATAVFHGILHNERALRNDLGTSRSVGSVNELIAGLYDRHGVECIARLEGEFCVALVDPARRQLLVATDTIGNYPIYWRADTEGLIFTSDLSALIRASPSAARLSLRAVADYLTIGAIFGDKTLAEDVHVLNPGTVLTYDTHRATVSTHPYASIETFFRHKVADKSSYLEAVEGAFAEAVARAARANQQVGLSLSGGLDSRALLSAIAPGSGLKTYTLGVEGCADQVIADQLARIAGTEHVFFRLDSTYLHDFLPNMTRMVSITDGMYLSHGLTEMLAIQFLDQTGIRVLLRGHGGELAKARLAWPLHTDDHVHGMKSLDELVPYLSARANYVTPNLPLSRMFTPEASAAAGEGTRETFAALLRDTGLSPADACSYLYLRELNRRFTVPSLELFRTRVEVRLPYLDPAFLKVLLAAPSEWRDGTVIHRRLIASGNAALLNVRNSNTGARVNAGPIEEFVFDKCNTALKRLNVRGYRHYHNFDGWMRTNLLASVETELLKPSCLVQGFVPLQNIKGLIRETREGAADHSYLLQILLILELWQRENGIEAAA